MSAVITRLPLRRVAPGEVGSHFDTTTTCPGQSCPAAAYRPGTATGFGADVACAHGTLRPDLAYAPVTGLARFAPFVPDRSPR